MNYRREIDGLRALAVIPVIFFHAGFEIFSGGFVGVDVFFVISGYLITTIIMSELVQGKFSIINFYERRARRILPALFFVVLVCIPFAWILLSDTALNKFGNGIIGVSLFVSNVIFYRDQLYFDESAELNPLIHTWSLAVEEQYYAFFPILLIFIWRFGKKKVFWLIVVAAAISLILSEWGWRNRASANFYLAPTRAWELFAGSITAFIVQKRGVQKNEILALLGLAAIVFSIFAYDKNTPFPSVYTLVPVLGVVILILHAAHNTIVAKLLSTKAFVGIGLISYSAYLWHQPLFVYARVLTNQMSLENEIMTLLFIIIFSLAYLSWKYIENPFRIKSAFSSRLILGMSSTAIIVTILLGVVTKNAVSGVEYELAKKLSQNKFVYFEDMDERKFVEGRLIFPLKNVDSLIVGSSRIMQVNSNILNKTTLNLSVSGATIEDDIAFALEAIAKLNIKNIYISADPWLLNSFEKQNRFRSVINLYEYWIERATNNKPLKSYFSSDKQNIINDSQESVFKLLRKKLHLKGRLVPQDDTIEFYSKKAYDGFHIYNQSTVNRYIDISQDSPGVLNYAMKKFEYDAYSEKKLQILVKYLQSLGVRVTLVLSPYHPDVFALMEKKKPIFLDIENWFRRFAQDNKIEVVGSYDATSVGCKRGEFYDGMHPKSSCMQKLFNVVK
jgi:peptidoglycan/LPS O-acetylase OafA/YrhL